MNEIITQPPSVGVQPLKFSKPARALYATCPLWNSDVTEPPFPIHKYATFVMGMRQYRPLPFRDFSKTIYRLSQLGALEIKPSGLREFIETDPFQNQLDNLGRTYLLHNNVYMRFRRDGYSAPSEKEAVHTLMLIGAEQALTDIAEVIGLPHPFDNKKFPHKKLFRDPRDPILPVLR